MTNINAKEAFKTYEATNDISQTEKLYCENYGLAIYMANKFQTTSNYDRDDLYSLARIGLWKACKTYKKDHDVKFASYASKVIKNEILMYIRRFTLDKRSRYNTVSFDYRDEDGLILAEMVKGKINIEEIIEDQELKKTIIEIIKKNIKNYPTLKYYYIAELNQDETAKILNISQSYISRKIRVEMKILKLQLKRARVEI